MAIDVTLTTEGLERARQDSFNHHAERGNSYHDDWIPVEESGEKVYSELYDSDQPSNNLRRDKGSGIYLICEKETKRAYVGLAEKIGPRFYHGKPDHALRCDDGCSCWGHITATPETCRSHQIINSENGFFVYILTRIGYSGDRISQCETDWYYILLEHGFDMVNADWNLGKKGYVGRPVVCVNIRTGDYLHFPTISNAASEIYEDSNAGRISSCLMRKMEYGVWVMSQKQNGGYSFRYSTPEEIEIFQDERNITEAIKEFESRVIWYDNRDIINLSETCKGCLNRLEACERKYGLSWDGGAFSKTELAHILDTSYGKPRKSWWFVGVPWKSSANPPGWQCNAHRERDGGGRIWQSGPLAEWREPSRLFNHDIEAAIYREEKVRDEGWGDFNQTGLQYRSNAKKINFRQPWRFLIGKQFVDWRDQKSGFIKIILIYGTVLALFLRWLTVV